MGKKKRRKQEESPLHGLRASVILERAGACIRIDEVPADQAFNVLAELLGAMRVAARVAPELTVELSPVAGYTPVEVVDDDYAEESRTMGFHT